MLVTICTACAVSPNRLVASRLNAADFVQPTDEEEGDEYRHPSVPQDHPLDDPVAEKLRQQR